jgi:hypothetical protein
MEIFVPDQRTIQRRQVINNLNEIRDKLQSTIAIPNYERDKEFYEQIYQGNNEVFNCYAYALQLSKPLTFIDRIRYPYYIPGFLSGEFNDFSNRDELLSAFQSDCAFLGLETRETGLDEPLFPNSYKIVIHAEDLNQQRIGYYHTDANEPLKFHFFRQNDDGDWSQKFGWAGPVKRSYNPIYYPGCEYVGTYEISRKK